MAYRKPGPTEYREIADRLGEVCTQVDYLMEALRRHYPKSVLRPYEKLDPHREGNLIPRLREFLDEDVHNTLSLERRSKMGHIFYMGNR